MAHSPLAAALSLDGLGAPDARAGFDIAAAAGYGGIAFATNHPELNPDALGPSARRQVRTILAGRQLAVDSIRAAAPRGGLGDSATIDRTLDQARRAIALARELGVGTVAVNVGSLAGNAGVPEGTIVSALRDLSQHADAAGLTLAVGADELEKLPGVLKQVDFDRARINFEGVRLLGAGSDPLQITEQMAARIGQFTAADAVRGGAGLRSVELGEGQLPLRELLRILQGYDFRGPLVVDVRDLPDGIAGARHAAAVLRQLLAFPK